ncbi:hypothetical protein [Antrihabitans cavernicola]|uniref:Thymidylate kinase n=1 Tax=Antrihabitans cavernicola TaxID=2495913 RepID=A0A5A7SJN8_9NOCA|nr:hypothetical protein [Spelaeibacter cavernicola]KAA0024863.1 hypothetical protein FOY51_02745 [Spelaeibacter cavernicola]
MSRNRTQRIAVVGIDGCGKSLVISKMRAQVSLDTSFEAISCPDFHESANAPMHTLSRQLKALSDAADVVGNPVIKASALYLRMTLYGPVERFFVDTYSPRVLMCERHPLIETLVYAPLYVRLAERSREDPDALAAIRILAEERAAGASAAVDGWHSKEAARVHSTSDIWGVLGEIAELIRAGTPAALAGFGARYRTTLPDEVIWLETPPADAARRCAARTGATEVHETLEHLTSLRSNYLRMRDELSAAHPDMVFHTVSNSDIDDVEDVVRTCLDVTGMR